MTSTVPLVARTPATHVEHGVQAHLVEPGFNYRTDTTVPVLLSVGVAVFLGVVIFGMAFVIVKKHGSESCGPRSITPCVASASATR